MKKKKKICFTFDCRCDFHCLSVNLCAIVSLVRKWAEILSVPMIVFDESHTTHKTCENQPICLNCRESSLALSLISTAEKNNKNRQFISNDLAFYLRLLILRIGHIARISRMANEENREKQRERKNQHTKNLILLISCFIVNFKFMGFDFSILAENCR